jgi:hypothetical protein
MAADIAFAVDVLTVLAAAFRRRCACCSSQWL